MKRTLEDNIVDTINYFLLAIVFIVTFYPFFYLIIISFNDGVDATLGGIYFWPRKFTLINYTTLISDMQWVKAFFISVARTVVGVFFGVGCTSLVAYGLASRELLFKKLYFTLFIIGMYVSGGIIPLYVVLRGIGLLNTFWVYVFPGMLNIFLLFIAISFFREIPSELKDSARIDGASDLKIFISVVLPISKPLLATMSLFIGVAQWNAWLDSAYFVRNENLRTLTYRMIEVINKASIPTNLQGPGLEYATQVAQSTPYSLQITAMVISIVPIMCVYPFLQKYFVQGATLGAVKG